MSSSTQSARRRIGRVSTFSHHGSFYTYHRQAGKPIRQLVGTSEARAECHASLLNAKLVAAEAGLPLNDILAAVLPACGEVHGRSPVNSGISVSELRRRFLHHHEAVLTSALSTVARYTTATMHLERFAARQRIASALDINVADFTQYLRQVQIAPNGHPNTARKRLRDKGVRYVLECARSMYRFGRRLQHLPKHLPDPFEDAAIGALKIRDAKPIFVFDAEQELRFFSACDPWSLAIHFTLAKTGLRPGELVHLLIEDFDAHHGWLRVRGKQELGWVTKTNRERRVPLVAELVELLRWVIGTRQDGPVFLRASFFRHSTTPSVTGSRATLAAEARVRLERQSLRVGRPITRDEEAKVYRSIWMDSGAAEVDRIRCSFIRCAARAGIGASCPKSWRHTFATLLQEAGVDPLIRQEAMGHQPEHKDQSALGMTAVYTHTRPETLRRQIFKALRRRRRSLELVVEILKKSESEGVQE